MPFRMPMNKASAYGVLDSKGDEGTELRPATLWGSNTSSAYGSTRPEQIAGSFSISTGSTTRRSTK